MPMVKAILTKPLDGDAVGSEREFDQVDFDRLHLMGAVRAISEVKAAQPLQNKMARGPLNKSASA
ncbi:hypothetical protein [Sphingomonas sp. CFBP 8764]|uniref:hypothetical protein n=1 Tax=Sphingomonas sp. CFBP 8764 TaxID=2775275 RepID=UPI00177DC399|nr:hypothetical protein [Sphingomonas sp. CFBP 8764]MBD8549480.1 hypothetical protein [Sphingomonas sp. CFBP 8764]